MEQVLTLALTGAFLVGIALGMGLGIGLVVRRA